MRTVHAVDDHAGDLPVLEHDPLQRDTGVDADLPVVRLSAEPVGQREHCPSRSHRAQRLDLDRPPGRRPHRGGLPVRHP
jgi:hypothetical protein